MAYTKGLNHWADILVVILYFISVLGVGLWTLCRPNRGNVKNYFLAGRSMPWFAVGASLFSSNIGSEHFVGLAGAGAASGISLVLFEWFVIFLILALGWIFIPVYVSAGVYTLPEYIQKRHGGQRMRTYLSVLSLILYILTKLAVSIFAGSLFIQMALGWNMYISIAILLFITGLYTVLGGLKAVMYTDTLQTSIMTIGAIIVMGISFTHVGGYNAMKEKYMEALPSTRDLNSTCGLPRKDAFHIFLDAAGQENPWPGLVFQASVGCLWYWCCDQVIVQRSLAAKSCSHAKGGSLVAGYLKLLPLFLLMFPGMISRILYPDEVACVDSDVCMKVCDNPAGCSNIAYPKLVMELMPVGLRGFMIAAMMSAIMSSLTSIFNSASTVFTMDIWRRVRTKSTQKELLIVGRLFIVLMCTLSILWIPLVKSAQGGKLFTYMVVVEGYLGSPLGVLFLISIFWKGTTEAGAFWGLLIGHVVGGTRLILEFVYPAPACGEPETRPEILYKLHSMYFIPLLLVLTAAAIVVISMFTTKRTETELVGVTWWTRYDPYTVNRKDKVGEDNITIKEECDSGDQRQSGGLCSRFVVFMFGSNDSHLTQEIQVADRKTFIQEKRLWRIFLNVLAVFLIAIIAFLCGFYR
ncbi:sodium/glucose cotransporter 4-like isoform X1 [Mytilus edulis]|uniref:sodium/glucose cotransporter 4-like isoform X1 n=1 Tax=Mytilus edulis TaxID=6550 RepID=UPI0039EF9AA0